MSVDDTELVRYWFTFDLAGHEPGDLKPGRVRLDGGTLVYRFCSRGVGVTGYDHDDCLRLVARELRPAALPPVVEGVRDIDVDALGLDHRFVGTAVWRGVWYPPVNRTGPTIG